ncbi:TIGR01244 family sulfur transferase [Ferruginivarius sediminum]|uniref:TIGR01244 family phosphatase n=1 Tax=Ferruginivarius sediminum TaxID=2661937 RepID=A0A369TD88_9PROT|nr:TIGR01244 family sulfur transferase [Ferruginivarius sediminum]RDD62792.1 TIGR01244 family phosphatase [Ferruginivarius sediminum]
MLNVRMLDKKFSAAGQLTPEDIAEAARRGFKAIINNRPDGEGGPEQPTSDENRKAAEAAGMDYHYLPMTPQNLDSELLEAFRKAVEEGPGPVLAHCKSGARSAALWALVETAHNRRDIDEVLKQAAKEGYDLSGMRPVFEKFVAAHNA